MRLKLPFFVFLICFSTFLTAQNYPNLRGSYWSGTAEVFTSIDLNNGQKNDLAILTGVSTLSAGESTINLFNGTYINNTNLGLTVIDANTGSILNTFNGTGITTLKLMEYDTITQLLYGSYWSGTEEIFSSVDLTTGTQTDIAILPGVSVLQAGESALNMAEGTYYSISNLGLMEIDIQTGNILGTYANINNLKGIELDPTTGHLYGSYWNGSAEKLAYFDFNTSSIVNIGTLTGVSGMILGESAIDPVNDLYLCFSNLGLLVIDFNTANILGAYTYSNYIKGMQINGGGSLPTPQIELINVSSAAVCEGDCATLSVTDGYASYVWSNGATTSSICVADEQSYSVTMTDNNGDVLTSNLVSINVYDCTNFVDSIDTTIDSCLLDSLDIVWAFTTITNNSEDTIFLDWNFVTAQGDTFGFSTTYLFNENGVYMLLVYIDCNGKRGLTPFVDMIEIDHLTSTGILELSLPAKMKLYPNPVQDVLFIDTDASLLGRTYQIISLDGVILQTHVLSSPSEKIDLSDLPEGIYFLNIEGLEKQMQRFIKLR